MHRKTLFLSSLSGPSPVSKSSLSQKEEVHRISFTVLPPLLIDLSSWLPTSTQFLISPNSVFAASFLASSSSNLTPTTVVWSSSPVPSSSSPSLPYLNTSFGRNAFPGNPSASSSNSTVSLSLRGDGCLIFGSGWRSFDYPTDTFLPGQTMNRTRLVSLNGRFSFDGEVLTFNDTDVYWPSYNGNKFLELSPIGDFEVDDPRNISLKKK